jgi:hypothetical protein
MISSLPAQDNVWSGASALIDTGQLAASARRATDLRGLVCAQKSVRFTCMNERLLQEDTPAGRPASAGQSTAMIVIAVAVGLIGIAGFAGWFAHGDNLFWSLLQAGFAWCM